MNCAPTRSHRGQSLIEVLIALAVFVVGVATVGLTALAAGVSSRQGLERTQATLLAREGLEAARSLRDAGFDNLAAGPHGIALSGNVWTFSGASDVQDQFTRIVSVTNVDVDTKNVTSTVSWQFTPARPETVSLTDYFTDWNQTQGRAGALSVDLSDAVLDSLMKQLEGITIRNTGSSAIRIDKMTVWWNGTAKLNQIRIDGTNVFGPVLASSAVISGTEIDITNFILTSGGGTKDIDRIAFTDVVSGTDFIIKFIMTDGSTKFELIDL